MNFAGIPSRITGMNQILLLVFLGNFAAEIPPAPGQHHHCEGRRWMGNRENSPQHGKPNPVLGLMLNDFTEKIAPGRWIDYAQERV
jgi:hypothetical protein